MKQSWYRIQAASDGEFEVVIYDEIGFWGVSAKDFITDFRKIPADAKISLRINSPGGEVFDGLAIYNLIRAHGGEVTTTIDGLAASMASVIALAGSKVIMPENAYMMIHNPWGIALGDDEEMHAMGDMLGKLNATLAAIYVKKSGQEPDKIRSLMKEETWLTAAEAKELGLADEIAEPAKLAARASWKSKFAKLPLPVGEAGPAKDKDGGPSAEELKTEAAKAADERARKILEVCARAGVADAAVKFFADGLTVEQVSAKLADADKIRARCVAAKLPDRANGYIKAGMSVHEVASALFDTLLARQGDEIDNKLGPEGERGAKDRPATISVGEIYALRNKRK